MIKLWPFSPSPTLTLGTYAGGPPIWNTFALRGKQTATHLHVMGLSGTGKSKFLEGLCLQMIKQRLGGTFIDPHADSVNAVLALLTAQGFFDRPDAFDRLLYIELREEGPFLAFNVLKQRALPHTICGNFKEALHRAWPALSGGAAPMFDTLVQDGAKVLISNNLPVTALYRLLTDKDFRDQLLQSETDFDVVSFFHDQFDRLSVRDQVDQAGAALRRAHLLTFNPVLKYSTGQTNNVLDFARIIDSGTFVLFNLGGVQDQEARRLLGCLITIGYEQAALSREGTNRPRVQHHFILDEMGEFVSQSEQGLSRILSQARKYGLFSILAHQTWSETTAHLRGALQNCQVEVAFGIGRADAEEMSKSLGKIDLQAIKHEVADERALERSHPVFYSLSEQWEQWIAHLVDLPQQNALVKIRGRPTVQIVTPTVPSPKVDPKLVEQVKAEYRRRLMMKPASEIVLPHQIKAERVAQSGPRVSRVSPIAA